MTDGDGRRERLRLPLALVAGRELGLASDRDQGAVGARSGDESHERFRYDVQVQADQRNFPTGRPWFSVGAHMMVNRTAFALLGCLAACADAPGFGPVARVDGDHHITVRAEAGHLWWAHRPWTEPHELWTLPSTGTVANLAIRPVASDAGAKFEITFEQGGVPWRGELVVDEQVFVDSARSVLNRNERRVAEMSQIGDLARSGR